MTNESISVDQQNGKSNRVSKYLKFVLHAAELFITGKNTLSLSTGYIEYNNINSKIDKVMRAYDNINEDSGVFSTPQKRRADIWAGNYPKRTNKMSKIKDRTLQSSKSLNEYEHDLNKTSLIFNEFDFFSCPDDVDNCSRDTIRQFDCNYSFPVDGLHQSVENEDIQKQKVNFETHNDFTTTIETQHISIHTDYTQWEVINKQSKNEIFLTDKEKLHVLYDDKKRVNGYFVSFDLSQDSDIDETELDEDELRAIEILSRHSNIDKQSIDWENTEDLYKIGYCNFKLPPRDLASDVLRCEECNSVPKYKKIKKLLNSSKFGDFSGLLEDQKTAQNLQKRKSDESKTKRIKRVTAIKSKNVRNTKSKKKTSKDKSKVQTQEINTTSLLCITEAKYKFPDDVNSSPIDFVPRHPGKYECEQCGSTFTSAHGRKNHIKRVHTTEKELVIKPYQCRIENCTKKYKTRNGLKYHRKKHHASNVVCK